MTTATKTVKAPRNATAVVSRIVRYVDFNEHVPPKNWDYYNDEGELVGMSQRMGAVWFTLEDGSTAVTFTKRTTKLWQAMKATEIELLGSRQDSDDVELGAVVTIKSSKVKRVAEACEHKGEFLPERIVLTHVILS